MDLPASLKNLSEFLSKHKFLSIIFSCFTGFICFIFFHYLLTLLNLISGFLVKMYPSLMDFSYLNSSSFLITATVYVRVLLEIEILAVLGISIASLLKSSIQILLSDAADKRTEFSFKDKLARVTESAKRLLFTWFYVRLLKLGYIFVGILVFLPQVLNIKIQDLSDLSAFCGINTILVVLALLGTVLYMYLAVVWNLALVVSLREDKSGIEAFGRASELAEEKKLQIKLAGLFLNMAFGVSTLTLLVLDYMASTEQPAAGGVRDTKYLLAGLTANEVCVWVWYTVLHLKCKKDREAAMQLDVSLEHKMSPQYQPLISELA